MRSLAVAGLGCALMGTAFGQTFSNNAPIAIPNSGMATPYPSTINVSGVGTQLTNITVDLFGLSHTFPDDFGMVLVGPTGAALLIQDGAGDGTDMVNVSYTLSDAGAGDLPNAGAWGPGVYQPTAYYTGDSFGAPGPGLAYNHPGPAGGNSATFASTFNGTNPNGAWNLYVVDFVGGDEGQFAGGWAVNLTAVPEPASTTALALGALGLIARRRRNRKS
jgi:hypothetical protein